MDTKGIESMLNVLRTTAAQASGKPSESAGAVSGGADFAQVLQNSIAGFLFGVVFALLTKAAIARRLRRSRGY